MTGLIAIYICKIKNYIPDFQVSCSRVLYCFYVSLVFAILCLTSVLCVLNRYFTAT